MSYPSVITDQYGYPISGALFFSVFGKKGQGKYTEDNPGTSSEMASALLASKKAVIGRGRFEIGYDLADIPVYGIDKYNSHLVVTAGEITGGHVYKNLTFSHKSGDEYTERTYHNFYNCVVNVCYSGHSSTSKNTLFTKGVRNMPIDNFVNCTMLSTAVESCLLRANNSVYAYANIPITSVGSDKYNKYTGFANCKFSFIGEMEYTPLVGTTPDELKADFVRRANAAGITVTTSQLSKWIFSNNSLDMVYAILPGSEMDLFCKSVGIDFYIGHEKPRVTIPITHALSANSFNNNTGVVSPEVVVRDNFITLLEGTVTKPSEVNYFLRNSGIIELGSMQRITSISITNNLPLDFSIAANVQNALTEVANGKINPEVNYVIRGGDDAVVTYNTVDYQAKPSLNNFVFRGVVGVSSFTVKSSNAKVYKVIDYANNSTIGIRTAVEYARTNVEPGTLKKGFWYYVTEGSITYNGVNYTKGTSFLSTSASTFTGIGKINEVFADDEKVNPFIRYEIGNISYIQEGVFIDKMKHGSDGVIVGSAHPEYNALKAALYPSKNAFGRIIQYQLGISTGN